MIYIYRYRYRYIYRYTHTHTHTHTQVDNLPVAMSVFHEADDGQTIKAYETGYVINPIDV